MPCLADVPTSEIIARLFAPTPLTDDESATLFDAFLTHFFLRCSQHLPNTSYPYAVDSLFKRLFPHETLPLEPLFAACLKHPEVLTARYHATDNSLHRENLLRMCHYALKYKEDDSPIPLHDQFLDFVISTYPDSLPYYAPFDWTRLNSTQVLTAWSHPCRPKYQPTKGNTDWTYIAEATHALPIFSEVCTAFFGSHREESKSILPDNLSPTELTTFESAIPSPTHYSNCWFLYQPHSSATQQLRALRALGSRKIYSYPTIPICLRFTDHWTKLNHKQRCQAYIHLAHATIQGSYPSEALPSTDTFASTVLKLTLHNTGENQQLLEDYTLYREWTTHYRTYAGDPVLWWRDIRSHTITSLYLDNHVDLMDHLSVATDWFKQQDRDTQALRGWYLKEMLERINNRYSSPFPTQIQLTRINHLLTRRPPFLIYPPSH